MQKLKMKQPMHQLMNKKGFTLVELIVVIAIIAILAAILIPVVTNYVSDARQAAVDANAQTFALAVQTAFADLISDNNTTQADALLSALAEAEDEDADADEIGGWTSISTITADSSVLANILGTGFTGFVIVEVSGSVDGGVQLTKVWFSNDGSDPTFVGSYPQ